MERIQMDKQMWLLYFNRVLLEKQLITSDQYQKMHSQILRRTERA